MNENLLKNKNCLITGSTGGLGKEISYELAKKGCNLFLTSRAEKNLKHLRNGILSINKKIRVFYEAGDLTNLNDVNKIIKKVRECFNNVDILVNSAGVFIIKSLSESTLKDYEICFNLNVRAPFLLSKEFGTDMIQNKWGRIVNIGSSSSYKAFKNGSLYCASKFSILGLSRSLHEELKEYNVRTFCISPGSIKTKMAKISIEQDFSTFLNPREVAEFIVFLISFDKEMVVDETQLNRIVIR